MLAILSRLFNFRSNIILPYDVVFCYYYYFTPWEFFISALADGLSLEFQSLHKSPGLFSLFWPFLIMPPFRWSPLVCQLPNPPVPFYNPFVTVPKAPITCVIIVTFMFQSLFFFFNSLARSRYLSFFSHSFSFILWSAGTTKFFDDYY